MVEDTIKSLSNEYNTAIKTAEDNKRIIYTLASHDDSTLVVEIVGIEDQITEVYFLNNQFYELEQMDLISCIKDILSGNYTIHKKLIGKGRWIVTNTKKLAPERTQDNNFNFEVYDNLPKSWISR